jgi:hypothetical protein
MAWKLGPDQFATPTKPESQHYAILTRDHIHGQQTPQQCKDCVEAKSVLWLVSYSLCEVVSELSKFIIKPAIRPLIDSPGSFPASQHHAGW